MRRTCWTPVLIACFALASVAQAAPLKTRDVLEIWPAGVGPGSENSPAKLTVTERSKVAYWPDRALTGITRPNLTAFVPDKPNGTAVIVAPGGAYTRIAIDKESSEMARWLNPYGVTVFLMQYRLPAEGHANGKDAPLQDAQRALRYVRAHAKEWNLNPARIGFLGASAAGHMGASLDVQYAKKVYEPVDEADALSARPDFSLLLYPITTMENGSTHLESRTNLIGKDPSPELIKAYSPVQNIIKDAPPTFVVLAEDDPAVPPINGISFCNGLKQAGASCELHTFKEGGHGFGIRDARQLPVSVWPNLAADWLKANGFIQ
jgi:acetyl esterase/lipase